MISFDSYITEDGGEAPEHWVISVDGAPGFANDKTAFDGPATQKQVEDAIIQAVQDALQYMRSSGFPHLVELPEAELRSAIAMMFEGKRAYRTISTHDIRTLTKDDDMTALVIVVLSRDGDVTVNVGTFMDGGDDPDDEDGNNGFYEDHLFSVIADKIGSPEEAKRELMREIKSKLAEMDDNRKLAVLIRKIRDIVL